METNVIHFFRDEDLVVPCKHQDRHVRSEDGGLCKRASHVLDTTNKQSGHVITDPDEFNKTVGHIAENVRYGNHVSNPKTCTFSNIDTGPDTGHTELQKSINEKAEGSPISLGLSQSQPSISMVTTGREYSSGETHMKNDQMVLYHEFEHRSNLTASITLDDSIATAYDQYSRVYLTPYKTQVHNHSNKNIVVFSQSYQLFISPSITWNPDSLHTLTVLVYPCDRQGACLRDINVMSGSIIKSRDLFQLDADSDSLTCMRYSPTGQHIVVAVLEKCDANNHYLTRLFVLGSDTFSMLSRSDASIAQLCHAECLLNVRPQFSVCSGYVCVPGERFSRKPIHSMPKNLLLKDISRRRVLQLMPRNDNNTDAIHQLDIPQLLKTFLMFK